jgi:uncharacterized protein involved in exopolysaccharide biosynthesis
VKKLNLQSHPDFDVRQTPPTFLNRVMGTAVADPSQVPEEEVIRRAIGRFKRGLQVGLVRNSQLVVVSFSSFDQDLAARVPNTLAETFIESDLESRMAMTQKAAEWLRERMGELRSKVDASERALQDYRERERIVDVKGVALSGASKQLEALTGSLVESRQKRAEAEAALTRTTDSCRPLPGELRQRPRGASQPDGAADEVRRSRRGKAPERRFQALWARASEDDPGEG